MESSKTGFDSWFWCSLVVWLWASSLIFSDTQCLFLYNGIKPPTSESSWVNSTIPSIWSTQFSVWLTLCPQKSYYLCFSYWILGSKCSMSWRDIKLIGTRVYILSAIRLVASSNSLSRCHFGLEEFHPLGHPLFVLSSKTDRSLNWYLTSFP